MNESNPRAKVAGLKTYHDSITIPRSLHKLYFFNTNYNFIVQILFLKMDKPRKSRDK